MHYSDAQNIRDIQVRDLKEFVMKIEQLYNEKSDQQRQVVDNIKNIEKVLVNEEDSVRKNIKNILTAVIQERDDLKQQVQ